jgi:long-subunit acyl-CoA synthetase (AMP-forming)
LHSLLRAGDAGRPALRDDTRRLSRGELAAAIDAELAWLQCQHVERWALQAPNGVAWAVADLALHGADAPIVPLPTWFTPAQRAHALDDAGVDGVLTDASGPFEATGWSRAGTAPGSGLHLLRRGPRAPVSPWPAGAAKLTYTSGSTGTPKGVPLAAATLEAVARSVADSTSRLDLHRHVAILPLATLLENVAGLYASLVAGAECVLPAATGVGAGTVDVPALLRCLADGEPQSAILVPELLRVLVAARRRGWPAPPALRFLAVGGAAVAPDLLREAAALGLPVHEGYGLSECGSVVCLNVPGANRPGSVGRPLPHAQVRVAADGEVHVRGAVACGSDEIATGDLGEFDADGFLHLRGRRRNEFITSLGRNVSPEWVERELLADAAIAQAYVCGEARPQPVALLVPMDSRVSDADLARAVATANARLPDYARVRDWTRVPPFTPADDTLTANGRPRRERIRERHATTLASLVATTLAS